MSSDCEVNCKKVQNVKTSQFSHIHICTRPGVKTKGLLRAGGRVLPCALGRAGIATKRGEGDGITPRGTFHLLAAMVRADRVGVRNCSLGLHLIGAEDGWCDAAGDRNYNQPVRLPYPASHERLMREDHLYDIAWVMDFNVRRRMTVGGSAIFFHLAHDDYRPTEGCVAISREHMLWLLPHIGRQTVMVIK